MKREHHPPRSGPILCLAITPAVQRTLFFDTLQPGEVNRARRTLVTPAGKGVNVALALARLGCPVRLVGLRGGDSGDFIARELRVKGIDARWGESTAPTRHCHTLVETDTGRVTELVEEAAVPDPATWKALEDLVLGALPGCSWLAISGALPPGTPAESLARFCAAARQHGARLIIDSQGAPLRETLPARPEIVKLNAGEALHTFPQPVSGPDPVAGATTQLLAGGAGAVLVTDGPRPARLFESGSSKAFKIPAVNVVNPIGSGDCVTAGLLAGLQEGLDLAQAARFGLACGSANAETATPAEFDPARARALADRPS